MTNVTTNTATMTGLSKPETQRQRGTNNVAITHQSQRANNIDNSMENGTSSLFVSSFHEEKRVKNAQQTYDKRILWIRRILGTVLFLVILEYGSIWLFGHFW